MTNAFAMARGGPVPVSLQTVYMVLPGTYRADCSAQFNTSYLFNPLSFAKCLSHGIWLGKVRDWLPVRLGEMENGPFWCILFYATV